MRRRFDEENIAAATRAAWWDWPVELATEHAWVIIAGEPAELERIAAERGCFKPEAADRYAARRVLGRNPLTTSPRKRSIDLAAGASHGPLIVAATTLRAGLRGASSRTTIPGWPMLPPFPP